MKNVTILYKVYLEYFNKIQISLFKEKRNKVTAFNTSFHKHSTSDFS